MRSDETNPVAAMERVETPERSVSLGLRWWMQVLQVRLRFLLIFLVSGGIVSQWPLLRSTWERWGWNPRHTLSGSVSSSHEYFCPMDAGVISVWPAICPICNMDLVPRRKMDAAMLPSGVIARMQLSPYRIQLAGIRTSLIESRPLNDQQTFSGILRTYEDGSVGFDTSVPESDRPFFTGCHPAELRLRSGGEAHDATARLVDESRGLRVQFTLDDAESMKSGTVVVAHVSVPISAGEDVLVVPESAVIDRGPERLVYVETMPGMFDGVKVELGRRCGPFYPVVNGLKTGQKVASSGAFLIDAESRLNPGLAAGFFGANQSGARANSDVPLPTPSPKPPLKKANSPKQPLTVEDQALISKQRICPVTELPLESMGGAVPVIVRGRKIFICCVGCEQPLKNEPDKFLARLSSQ